MVNGSLWVVLNEKLKFVEALKIISSNKKQVANQTP